MSRLSDLTQLGLVRLTPPSNRIQGSGNKKWNGAGGLGSILDKSLERCNRTALSQKICCYGEMPLKPHPLQKRSLTSNVKSLWPTPI